MLWYAKDTMKSLFLMFLLVLFGCGESQELQIQKYPIEKTPKLHAIGSGLTHFTPESSKRGEKYFYTVSDGGNAPSVLELRLRKRIVEVTRTIPLKVDTKLDLEGIAVSQHDSVWLANEDGPSLIEFDTLTGRVVRAVSPANGLPLILRSIQASRGFEGVSVTDSKVYATLQSVLDIGGKTKRTAQFIRIIAFNPDTNEVNTYAYPLGGYQPDERSEVSISDLTWIKDDRFLVIESISNNEGSLVKSNIIEFRVSDATDITKLTHEGSELEFISEPEILYGRRFSKKSGLIKSVEKRTVLDLSRLGWNGDLAEGLTILPDLRTLVISNDADTQKPELWFIRLPEVLVVDWESRVGWIIGIVLMIGAVLWALWPQNDPRQVYVNRMPEDDSTVISTDEPNIKEK